MQRVALTANMALFFIFQLLRFHPLLNLSAMYTLLHRMALLPLLAFLQTTKTIKTALQQSLLRLAKEYALPFRRFL